MTMLRVAVSGAGGRMGRLVSETVAYASEMELVARHDPERAGERVAGGSVTADPALVEGADVVVEFTRPDVVMDNLAGWRRMGVHAVVGTSGFDEERLDSVRELWKSGPPNCLIVPNFSIGAVIMMHLAGIAAPHFDAAEIVELHHDAKVDAPSGTALATANVIAAAAPEQRRAAEMPVPRPRARGKDVAGIPVHAVRLPGLVAHQEVLFGSMGETLSIRHDTTDRQSFMPGVVLAVRRVADLPGVTVGLERLLGLSNPAVTGDDGTDA